MSRPLLSCAFAAAAVALVLASGAAAAGRVSVAVDRTRIATKLGHTFVVRTTITNRGSTAASGLIAHLNVLSLRGGVEVDPEDWSTHRTRYLAPIPAGGSRTTEWPLQAVYAGRFGVYIAVMQRSGTARPPATGPAVRVAVTHRKTLNSGGILPLALGIPLLLGLLTAGFRLRRRSA